MAPRRALVPPRASPAHEHRAEPRLRDWRRVLLEDAEVVAGYDLATVYRPDLLEQHVLRVSVGLAAEARPMVQDEQPGPRLASDLRQLDRRRVRRPSSRLVFRRDVVV